MSSTSNAKAMGTIIGLMGTGFAPAFLEAMSSTKSISAPKVVDPAVAAAKLAFAEEKRERKAAQRRNRQ